MSDFRTHVNCTCADCVSCTCSWAQLVNGHACASEQSMTISELIETLERIKYEAGDDLETGVSNVVYVGGTEMTFELAPATAYDPSRFYDFETPQ